MFKSDDETTIKELPLLKCQVIEPNLGDGKEVIASIPIKLSVSLICLLLMIHILLFYS